MKKWLFSKNGKILGPFAEEEANEFVMANPEAYAWHPSYSHWMPVTCVSEFEDSLPAPKPPSIIPKELIEEFIDKERKLLARFSQLDEDLVRTDGSLLQLDEEIKNFQDITENCTAEVKATLHSIEQQFASLSKNLSSFKGSVADDKETFGEISQEFNERVEKDKQPTLDAPTTTKPVKIAPQIQSRESSNGANANTVQAVSTVNKAGSTVSPKAVNDNTTANLSGQSIATSTDVAVAEAEVELAVAEAETAKVEAEKLAAEKLAAEKLAAKKAAAEKAEAEKAAAEKAAAEKAEAEKAEAEKAEAEKVAAEKAAAEKAEAEKAEAEKVAAEKAKVEKAKAEKAAAVKVEAEKLAIEKAKAVAKLSPEHTSSKVQAIGSAKKSASVSTLEFNDQPSDEDLLLASQLKMVDKPVSTQPVDIKPAKPIVGEFDHILYDSLEPDALTVDDENSKKRLRRRRRR
jgi:uncharacterized protein DUF4339